jgi:hypothetical protein
MGKGWSAHETEDLVPNPDYHTEYHEVQFHESNKNQPAYETTYSFQLVGTARSGRTCLYHQLKRNYTAFHDFPLKERKHAQKYLLGNFTMDILSICQAMNLCGESFHNKKVEDDFKIAIRDFVDWGRWTWEYDRSPSHPVWKTALAIVHDDGFLQFWEKHKYDLTIPNNSE